VARLTPDEELGELPPSGVRSISLVHADHAGKSGPALGRRLATTVGRGVEISALRQGAGKAVRIGCRREKLGHDAHRVPTKRGLARYRCEGSADDSAIDELAGGKPRAVRRAAGGDAAGEDGNNVRRSAADVEKQPIGERAAKVDCGRVPVGRCDGSRLRPRLVGTNKFARRGVDRETLGGDKFRQHIKNRGHPRGAIGKEISEFARHGDGMPVGGGQVGERGSDRVTKLVEPAPEGAWQLQRRDDASILDEGKLQVRAADIPTEKPLVHIAGRATGADLPISPPVAAYLGLQLGKAYPLQNDFLHDHTSS